MVLVLLALLLIGCCAVLHTMRPAGASYLDTEENSLVSGTQEGQDRQEELSSSEDSVVALPDLHFQNIPVETFRVSNLSPDIETDEDYVDWWYSEWEDCRYLFLPVTADRKHLHLSYEAGGGEIALNGVTLRSGTDTDIFSTADSFEITLDGTSYGTLRVMQSNLGCIYMTPESGSLDYIEGAKKRSEPGKVLMLNADGGVEYDGDLEKITSHGNSSWDYSAKKPYNIKLPQKENLYGMGKAKKWALLSNYLDHSMLRNAVTMEMSRHAEMEYVMDWVFVDLYVCGSYRGTYQLYERVQIQKNRVNITDLEEKTEALNADELETYPQKIVGADEDIYMENSYKYYEIPNNPDDITGGYLIQFQLYNRYPQDAESGFVTSRGQAVEIDGPEYASKEQVEYIRTFVQELEDAIYSEDGRNSKGKHYSEYLDVDSFICAYLIQEITINVDAISASFYLYKESDSLGDGKLHCGPVWDFDFSYYNFSTSRTNSRGETGYTSKIDNLFAAYCPISGYDPDLTDDEGSGRPTLGVSWAGALYPHGDFQQRMAKIYFERFDPYLKELSDSTQPQGALITRFGEEILDSAEMNNARWHMYGGKEFRQFGPPNGDNFTECVDYVRSFVERRRAWLRTEWLGFAKENLLAEIESAESAIDFEQYEWLDRKTLEKAFKNGREDIEKAENYEDAAAGFEKIQTAIEETPRTKIAGDFNDDRVVDIVDAQGILTYYSRKLSGAPMASEINATQRRNGDMDKNDRINTIDAILVLQLLTQ